MAEEFYRQEAKDQDLTDDEEAIERFHYYFPPELIPPRYGGTPNRSNLKKDNKGHANEVSTHCTN